MTEPKPLKVDPIFYQWVARRASIDHVWPHSVIHADHLAAAAEAELGRRVAQAIMDVDETKREHLPSLLAGAAVGTMITWMREAGMVP